MNKKEKKEKVEALLAVENPLLAGMHKEKFLHIVNETGLDPLRNQIYAVERRNYKDGKWIKTFTTQTSIDGFRLIAERTEKYAPGKEPTWNYDSNDNLESATAYVKKMTKDGTWHEVGATAYLDEYVQLGKDNQPTKFWKKMSRLMLAKCAEALALRKAFPDALSGVYTDDEMLQANNKPEKEKNEDEIEINKEDEIEINKEDEIEINKKDTISREQLKTLSSILENDPILLNNLMKGYEIDKLADLPESEYNRCILRIKEIKEKK